MKRRFSVDVDADGEVVALIGSKEGIFHTAFVLVSPGDVVLCPEPGYPVYAISTQLAGGQVHYLPLVAERDFLPDLGCLPNEICGKAKALWLCYPNNPTGAVADRSFYTKAVTFAQDNDLVLCVDAAYSEIGFDGYRALSVFEIPGAREVAVEFHSLSKSYNMTGWRAAFAVGRSDVIKALSDYKSNLDSGVFNVVQRAGIKAMEIWPEPVEKMCKIYRLRRDCLVAGLSRAGYEVKAPKGSFFLWMPVPGGDDVAFASRLVDEVGVVVTPGSGFGPSGKGYVRFALTVSEERLNEAVDRIRQLHFCG
jgi:LL-diaminopimelate aminotransferase